MAQAETARIRRHICGCETRFDTEAWRSVTVKQCAEHAEMSTIESRMWPSTRAAMSTDGEDRNDGR